MKTGGGGEEVGGSGEKEADFPKLHFYNHWWLEVDSLSSGHIRNCLCRFWLPLDPLLLQCCVLGFGQLSLIN